MLYHGKLGASPEVQAVIRPATIKDLEQLVAIERRSFNSDQISRRSFRHMLTRANASVLVFEEDGRVGGYALVLFSRATALSRLYSIAVDRELKGRGVGRSLLDASEKAAVGRGCVSMRSEVRRDNEASLALFRGAGYRQFEEVEDYYEDHMGAVRFERSLRAGRSIRPLPIPYYRQTTDFTCGPACLMMAMKALDRSLILNRRLELRIWREATSIFMTSGNGGCGPYGLALSAAARGFKTELFVKEKGVFLVDTVRTPAKKEVMRVVEADFRDRIHESGIPLHHRGIRFDEVRRLVDSGCIPVVLISSYRIYGERFPHWIVITDIDDHFISVHDPFVDVDEGETVSDCLNMPIARAEFERMARYGRTGQRAVIVLSRP